MSGHSKWAKLKHSKGAIDAKKSALFTKLGQAIIIAAREGGGDPNANFKLRLAIERAKKANLPKDNIERAIKRGTGEIKGKQIEEITYEAFGPGGTAFIVEALTDNKNRIATNIRIIFSKHGGNLAGKNSVLWMFNRMGVIRVNSDLIEKNKEEWELKIIELGVEDFKEEGQELVIYTSPDNLQKFKEIIEKEGIETDSAKIEWIAKEFIDIDEDKKQKIVAIFEELENDPDVQSYYTNIKH
ncbi:hypothetical protein B6D52_00715 [Candidatus Parcubacteria bacterium 4484_255]|nr:MAG: hypothetical protein B6D52_00715 [Candidatus Parcubacteria bacterium 4484_255]